MKVVFSLSAIPVTPLWMWLTVVQKHCDLGLHQQGRGWQRSEPLLVPDAAVTPFITYQHNRLFFFNLKEQFT